MLGAVMFGHRHFQPVIDAIIGLAEKAAKEPRDFQPPTMPTLEKEMLGARRGATCAPPMPIPRKLERHAAVDAAKAKVMAHFCPRRRRGRRALRQAAGRRRVQGARSQDRPLQHPRHRQAHRRPRPEDGAPDRVGGRRPAARPRLGAVHPRRDPGAGRRHARHRRGRAVHRRAGGHLQGDASCCTTTSRPSRSARPAAWARPGRREIGHGKLAWRAIRPMLPPHHEFPYTHPRRLRDHRVQRLVLDGHGLRHLAGADGCRRAAQAAGRRHRHGPDPGGRALRGALRHPRRRGPSRRHGLQGRRHRARASPRCRWTSRSPASPRRS